MQQQYVGRLSNIVEPPPSAPGPFDGVIGVREIWAIIVQRRRFILSFILLSALAISLAAFSMQDTYVGESALVLERNDSRMLEAISQLESEQRDRASIETEMDIITSRVFAGRVVDALNLVQQPWFNTYLKTEDSEKSKPLVSRVLSGIKQGVRSVLGMDDSSGEAGLPDKAVQRDRAITSLLRTLGVTRSGESFAVTVRVASPDPELSATLANTVADVYVSWSRDLKREALSEAVDFLRDRASQIAARIAANEREIADFSRDHELAAEARDDLLRQQVEEMNTQLTGARFERDGIHASLEQAMSAIAEPIAIEGSALDSPLLITLRGEKAGLLRQRAQYASNLAEGHPQILETDAQIASITAQIEAEIRRIVEDLSGKEKVTSERIKALETQIAEMQMKVRQRSLAEIRLRELDRDLLADQKLHDLVVARLGELDPFADTARPSARVVSVAAVPTEPSFPQRGPVLVGGVAGATILAIIIAIMFEATDHKVRSGHRIAQVSQLPNLASIPQAKKRWFSKASTMLENLCMKPNSTLAESFRSLYLSFRTRSLGANSILLVASPLPGDGASSVAQGIAYAAARNGARTIYVDLDCQMPKQRDDEVFASYQGTENASGKPYLGEIQAVPSVKLLDVLRPSEMDDRGPTGSIRDMEWAPALLQELRGSYDLIVVGAAPVLLVEDASWLSTFADAVLLVVRFGSTTERELLGATWRLNNVRAPLIGTVLNGVDPHARSQTESLGAVSYPHYAKAYFEN